MVRPKEPPKNRWFFALVACGGVCAILFAFILWFSFQFVHGENHKDRPIPMVLVLFGFATLVYLTGLVITTFQKSKLLQHPDTDRLWFLTIFAFGLLFRLIVIPSKPIQEIDYYRYLWDGRVLANGYNPYRYSPQQIDRFGFKSQPDSDLAELGRLSRISLEINTIFIRVHHRQVPTVYPPAAQVVFAASAMATPASAPLWVHRLVLKILLFFFDIGTFLVLALLLRRLNLPMCWSLAYGWCPLVMKEISNSAHLDSIAIFCTTAAVFLVVKAVQDLRAKENTAGGPMWIATAGTALLGVGVLAKSYPIILIPLFGVFLWRHFRWRCWAPIAACVVMIFLGYFAFSLRDNPSSANAQAGEAHHSFTGLKTFLTKWQMNDLLFMIVHENLRYDPRQPTDHPFVLTPRDWRKRWNESWREMLKERGWTDQSLDPSFLVTLGIMGLVLAGVAGFLVVRVAFRPGIDHFLHAVFLTLIWGWLLSAAQNPWYLLWSLPFMIFATCRSWFLLTGFAFMYYLRFWLEYQNLADTNAVRNAMMLFDFRLVWLEFMPFFIALIAETIWRRQRLNESNQTEQANFRPKRVNKTRRRMSK